MVLSILVAGLVSNVGKRDVLLFRKTTKYEGSHKLMGGVLL